MNVWVVTINEVVDYQTNFYSPKVFSTYEKAKAYFDAEVAEMKKELPRTWESEEGKDTFEMWESGYYFENHSIISIVSAVVDERVAD